MYRTFDHELGREIALKTLPALGADQIFYLKQEFRALRDISHPNLVAFHELVADEHQAFFTMDLVEGLTFNEYVADTTTGVARWENLARAGGQLMHALDVLHAAGRLHRDVKPGNVKVDADGRLVLLDFDLSAPLAKAGFRPRELDEVAGTAAYMAPEVAAGDEVGPAADVYSAGAMFFESLTGAPPFTGGFAELMLKKEREVPPALESRVPGLPGALNDLVARMLSRVPDERPGVGQVRRVLGALANRRSPSRDLPTSPTDVPFVGRSAELATLRIAFARVLDGKPALVHVEGPSGIGKTELVATFAAAIGHDADALVLRGRCHPQESVPFKALDGVVDEVTRYLRGLPARDRAALLPGAALLRLFPVLARVGARPPSDAPAEPHELRHRGVTELRELFRQLASRRRLVVWIDDLQWGDLDSIHLLRELWRDGSAPILWIVTSRRDEAAKADAVAALPAALSALAADRVARIGLGPLSGEEIAALAVRVLGAPPEEHVRALAEESAGSPFLLGVLARHLAGEPRRRFDAGVSLSSALDRRLGELTPVANDIVELTAVAGRPILRRVVLAASGAGESARPVVTALCQGLLRATQRDEDQWVATYHDRIRTSVLARLDPEARRHRHRQLAEALASLAVPDPLALVEHLAGAGDSRRAGIAALDAADRAAEGLAFELAGRLYRLAYDAREADPADWPRPKSTIASALAEALLHAGQGADAGDWFRTAAAALSEEAGDSRDVLRLRRRAAEALLRAGRLDEGRAIVDEVLAAVGLAMPANEGAALREVLWNRGRFLFHGTHINARPDAGADASRLDRLDVAWSATTGLSQLDQLRADALGTRHLLDAVALGERSRLARALAYEATFEATVGGAWLRRRAAALVESVYRLAAESGDPYDHAWSRLGAGIVACVGARWRDAIALCDEAASRFKSRCRGVAYEIGTAEFFAAAACGARGDLADLRVRLDRALALADERGDLFAASQLRLGPLFAVRLADDHADDALAEMDATRARWPDGALTQHYLHCLSTAQIELYRGAPEAAWERVEARWPALDRAGYLRLDAVVGDAWFLRGRVAVAMARRDPGRFVAEAERAAAKVASPALSWARPYAASIRAGVAAVSGDDTSARRLASEAAGGFAAADMALHAHAHAIAAGDASALEWFRRDGVREPQRFAAVYAPALSP